MALSSGSDQPASADAFQRLRQRCRRISLALAIALLFAGSAARAQAPQLTPPQLLDAVEPAYPAEALAAGLEARVVLRLTIDAEGRVTAAEVIEGAGHGFDEAVIAAVEQARFSPARRGETPVASRVLFSHEFILPPPAPPAPVAPPPAAGEEPELEVIVRKQSEAERLRRSAEAVQVLELEGEHREAADLGEVLARAEGVGVRRGGGLGSGTRFSLAGFTDDQIRFFLDGVPLELAGHPFGISNVPVNLVERVEIYRGVVPIRFGADALGGAVNLVTRREREGTHGFASYQIGSFGTHRLAAGASHSHEASGFFARATGFHDQAENDYTITVSPSDFATGRTLDPAEFDRFHDAYRGSGAEIELGLAHRPWARRLSLQGFLSDFDKELQHDQVMQNPYGDATHGELNGGLNLRYEQPLSRDATLHAIAGWAHERTRLLDVGTCIYDWEGNCARPRSTAGEIGSDPRDQVHETDSVFGRILLDWQLGLDHAVRVSLAPTAVTRTGDERRQPANAQVDPLNARRDLFTHVGGVEYEIDLFGGRLENIAFAKSYLQVVRSEEPIPGDLFRNRDRDTHHFGFGDALRYRFQSWLWGKASWELATRLPRPDEIFGDGVLVDPNLELAPERSHNFNLGATIDAPTTVGDLRFDVNGFLRQADQLIILYGYETSYQHLNVYGARSLGVEAAAGWTAPGGLFSVDGNATWVDMRNTSGDGVFGAHEGERIPNRPWLFANLAVRFFVRDTMGDGDDLELGWQSRYVHGFLRDWESKGAEAHKQRIQSQLLHAVSATQQVRGPLGALTFGAEVQNVTDAAAFDFYGLQRPGRSFHFKTTAEF